MTSYSKSSILVFVERKDGRIAQLGEHLPYKQRVTGSSPFQVAIFLLYRKQYGSIAQSVEQRTENPRVGGSIPPRTTKKKKPNLGFF